MDLIEFSLKCWTLERFGQELEIARDLRELLLCIVQISSGFLGSLHSFRKIDTRAFEATLCKRLQFREFTLFGVELARSVKCISSDFDIFNPPLAPQPRLDWGASKKKRRELCWCAPPGAGNEILTFELAVPVTCPS
jgi:hypothetical protein